MIEWDVAGDTTVDLLHYALPHHQDLLASAHKTNIYLSSPTKGDMMLVKSSTWEFYENDMTDMDFLPSATAVTNDLELEWVTYYLEREISATLDNYAGSSVYFGGKNLMAYAQLCLIADELNMSDLTETCLDQVESAFSEYVEGINGNPLVIDTTWGGLIGSAGLEEDNGGADFYAVYYNDHHFHYSYLVNAAAVLAKMRPAWATGDNKDFVETLIRDVNSPSTNDDHFPAFRSFDWFSGHSWARGLLFAFDGKDQESTSEDVNFYYAMTMWAIATGNSKLEGLGRLQTAMVARSIQRYFLLKDDNDVHPPDFVRNKVTGIFFESKIDYTTWFGDNVEYIHGIQNIPVTAITEYVRDPQFCKEEWDQRLAGVVGETSGSWTTVLYMSFATMERHLAFQQMLTSGVDDGLSRAWALYWAATRPDCDEYCPHVEVDLENVPLPTPAPTVPTGGFGGEASIPGLIQAEEYDYGGNGVGYGDTTPGNSGGFFRTDDVDVNEIETGLFYVGWTEPTEYLRYSVDVAIDGGTYIFDFSVASPGVSPPGSFRVVAGGTDCTDYDTDLTGLVEVPFTGGWREFATMPGREGASLAAGPAHLFICIESSGFNIDSFSMNAVLTPTPTPVDQLEGGFEGGVEIPGKIEAEKFDYGGPGVAYSDVDSGNNGGEFRLDEGVDIDTTDDGYYVGWTASSEYMRYTVDVTEAADAFDFEFVVAVPRNRSPAFRVVAGGSDCTDYDTDLSGVVQPSTTGPSWYGFESFSVQAGGDGGLPAGPAVLFFCTESSGFNIDSFTMTVSSDDDGSAYEGGADVPGTIEAERFDNGGQGVAYSDTDSSNKGREFRLDEGVDIDTTDDGYYVGWTASSEYMRYTVDVTEAADAFDFEFVVAVPRNRSPAFRVVAGGSDCTDYDTDLSGVVQPSATGPSWYRFESFSVLAGGTGGLPEGPATLFFCTESPGFNIDSFTMTVAT
ncbi:unnamed protein product [Sphacelaria rigidula]